MEKTSVVCDSANIFSLSPPHFYLPWTHFQCYQNMEIKILVNIKNLIKVFSPITMSAGRRLTGLEKKFQYSMRIFCPNENKATELKFCEGGGKNVVSKKSLLICIGKGDGG